VDGVPVELTALEFNLLAAVVRRPGLVVTREALLGAVWGPGYAGDDHLLDVHVANVRRKLGDDPASPRFLETVRGVGFRLRDPAPGLR
jgi:DNA-binding response OmpR family regulator